MIKLFLLIIVCFLMANQITIYSKPYSNVLIAFKKNGKVRLLFIIMTLMIILFSGLRTTYNDTQTYMQSFDFLDINEINFLTILEPYGGFNYLQMLIKKYITTDARGLIFISSIISNSIFLWFFSKYSKNFGWTILCYFILGPYVFSMAGIKQILAMSFSLFAINNLLKNKKLMFIFWILFSMLFHPYIICLLVLPFLCNKIYSKNLMLILIISLFFVINLDTLLNFAGLIGKDYNEIDFSSNSINPFRVIVEFIPIFLILINKNKLRKIDNKLFKLGINMLIFNFFMIFVGLFVDPIYFARIGTYFSSLNAITIPMMLCVTFENVSNKLLNYTIYYGFFALYFILDLTKLGAISIFTDLFNHRFF